MPKIFYSKRGQSILDYTMIVIVVSTALLAMTQYIHRAMNARLKQIQVELDESKR